MLSGGDQNVSRAGFTKVDGFSDPDDYVDIESGTYGPLQVSVYQGLALVYSHFVLCVCMGLKKQQLKTR